MELILSLSGNDEKIDKKTEQIIEQCSDIDTIHVEKNKDNTIKSLKLKIPGSIDIDISDGVIENFNIELFDVPHMQDLAREKDKLDNKDQKNTDDENSVLNDTPPIPDVDLENMSETVLQRYESMKNSGTQPHLIRKIIYDEGKLTREEVKRRLQQEGYDNVQVGEHHTGTNATLRILDKYTNEIERQGRGEGKILRWIGE
jgi:hypothetical protein